MKCFVVTYRHRHGQTSWPVFAELAPSDAEVIAGLGSDWEGLGSAADRDDEWIEVSSGYDLPEPAIGPRPEREPVNTRMYDALKLAEPLLIHLGDFIANRENRCEAVLAVREAIAAAEAIVPLGTGPSAESLYEVGTPKVNSRFTYAEMYEANKTDVDFLIWLGSAKVGDTYTDGLHAEPVTRTA